MTDRINGLFVVLEHDIRTDDVEAVVNAIQMIHHVLEVKKHVVDFDSHIASTRAKNELREKLWELLK